MKRQLEISSPLGSIYLVASEQGLCGIYFKRREVPMVTDDDAATRGFLLETAEQLQEYMQGTRRTFAIPFDLEGTAFQKAVWAELLKIPYGETISYKDLAGRLNRPKAYRAVGTANGRNPISLIIPCHRVITSDSKLGGYSGGLDRKSWLLRHETL